MAERIVINTGPLIALARMGALDVPGGLQYEFICPSEVRKELDEGASLGYQAIRPAWLIVIPLRATPSAVSVAALDKGDAAVIQLAAGKPTSVAAFSLSTSSGCSMAGADSATASAHLATASARFATASAHFATVSVNFATVNANFLTPAPISRPPAPVADRSSRT